MRPALLLAVALPACHPARTGETPGAGDSAAPTESAPPVDSGLAGDSDAGSGDSGDGPAIVLAVRLDPDPPATNDLVRVRVEGSDPGGAALALAYAWRVNGLPVPGDQGPALDGVLHFDRDDVIEVTVATADATAHARAVVANSAPTATGAVLGPVDATGEDSLTCVATGLEDPDPGDVPDVRPRWTVNGRVLPFAVLPLLTHEHVARGDTVGCTLVPTDGDQDGTPVVATPVVIVDLPPRLAGASLTPTRAMTGDTLACAGRGAADPDGDPVDVTYRWHVDGGEVIGAQAATLDGLTFDEGDHVACIATPVANGLAGEPVTSNVVIIGNSPPSATGLALWPTPLRVGDVPTCTLIGWSDPDADDVNRATCTCSLTDPGGSMTSFRVGTVPLPHAGTLACDLAPTDEAASGSPVTARAAVTHAPIATMRPLVPAVITTDTAAGWDPAITDEDGDLRPPEFAWYVNGARVAGVTGSSLDGGHFVKGDLLRAEVTPQDTVGPGATLASPEVTVQNSAPTGLTLVSTPDPAQDDDDLTCLADASDADGDTLRYAFAWVVSRAGAGPTESHDAVTIGNRSVLDRAFTMAGDTWTCTVRVTDDPASPPGHMDGWTDPAHRTLLIHAP